MVGAERNTASVATPLLLWLWLVVSWEASERVGERLRGEGLVLFSLLLWWAQCGSERLLCRGGADPVGMAVGIAGSSVGARTVWLGAGRLLPLSGARRAEDGANSGSRWLDKAKSPFGGDSVL